MTKERMFYMNVLTTWTMADAGIMDNIKDVVLYESERHQIRMIEIISKAVEIMYQSVRSNIKKKERKVEEDTRLIFSMEEEYPTICFGYINDDKLEELTLENGMPTYCIDIYEVILKEVNGVLCKEYTAANFTDEGRGLMKEAISAYVSTYNYYAEVQLKIQEE